MRMATYKDDMLGVLAEVEQTIDNRLKQVDTDTTPVVLVIDELAFLSKTSIGSQVAHTMERISTEGRKCAVYMLASSQTWLAARTGDSSVVRDTLTSAYVHRIKPKQANLLLQDKEEADKVKKYIKQAGEVLFCPVNDDSTVCRMPYTTENDMKVVAQMFKSDEVINVASHPVNGQLSGKQIHTQLPITSSAQLDPNLLTPAMLQEQMKVSPLGEEIWQKRLAEASGVSESLISNIVQGKKKLTTRTAKKLLPHLFDVTAVTSIE